MAITYLLKNLLPHDREVLNSESTYVMWSDKGDRAAVLANEPPRAGLIADRIEGDCVAYAGPEWIKSNELDDLCREAILKPKSPGEKKAALDAWKARTAKIEKLAAEIEALKIERQDDCILLAKVFGKGGFEIDGVRCHVGVRGRLDRFYCVMSVRVGKPYLKSERSEGTEPESEVDALADTKPAKTQRRIELSAVPITADHKPRKPTAKQLANAKRLAKDASKKNGKSARA